MAQQRIIYFNITVKDGMFFLPTMMSSGSLIIYEMNCDVLNKKSSPMEKNRNKVKVPWQ